MATALKTPPAKAEPRKRQSASRSQRSHLQAVPADTRPHPQRRPTNLTVVSPGLVPPHPAHPGIRKLPSRRPMPTWLRLLIRLQHGSVIVAFVLVTAALIVYGSTIYMQQHWSKGYNKLKTMQRSERQMIAAEGLMKNQLIQQAEKSGSGLVPRTAEHTIVLEQAPERVPVTANPVLKVAPPTSSSAPLGY